MASEFDDNEVTNPEPLIETPAPEDENSDVLKMMSAEALRATEPSTDRFGSPERMREDPDTLEAMASGFKQFGIATGVAEYTHRLVTGDSPSSDVDLEFNLGRFVSDDPVMKQTVENAMASRADPGYDHLVKRLENSVNSEQAQATVSRILEYTEARKTSEMAGMVPWLIGAGGGIVLDGILATALGGPAGAVATMSNIVKGTRATAALRVAKFGAAEGFLETAAQDLDDPGITWADYAAGTGFGALFGGIFGAAMPSFMGKTITREAAVKAEREIAEALEEARRAADGDLKALREGDDSASAARVAATSDDLVAPTATRGTGSTFIPKALQRGLKNLRTPKRRLADAIVAATKERAKGFQGNDRLVAVLSKMYKLSTMTADDLELQGRTETLQEGLQLMQNRLAVHELQQVADYDAFVAEAFHKGPLQSKLMRSDLGGPVLRKMGDETPSMAEVRWAADMWSQARAEGDPVAQMEILGDLKARIPEEHHELFENTVRKMADRDDQWFEEFGRAEADLGLIDGSQLAPGYRSQNWDTDVITAHQAEFTGMLMGLLGKRPDMEWIAREFGEEVLGEAEDFDALMKSRPDVAEEALEAFEAAQRELIQERIDLTREQMERHLEEFADRSVERILQRNARGRRNLQTQIRKKEDALRTLRNNLRKPSLAVEGRPDSLRMAMDAEEMATELSKLEIRMEAMVNDVRELSELQGQIQRLERTLQKDPEALQVRRELKAAREAQARKVAADREAGRPLKDAQATLGKVDKIELKLNAKKFLRETADEITQAITRNRSPGGFQVDDAIVNSRFFKRRTLDLKGVRHKPEWQKFLRKDSHLNNEIYSQAVGRQLEIRRKYAPFLRAQGYIPDDEVNPKVDEALKKYIRDGFWEDRRVSLERGDTAEVARIERDVVEAQEFIDRAFGEFTRSDYIRHLDTNADRWVSIAQSAVSSMALGKVALSMISDLAMFTFAGGRVGTGWKQMLKGWTNKGILEDIENVDALLAMHIRGENVVTNGLAIGRFDIDAPSLEVPGGMLAKVQRTASSVAQLEAWVNLMNPWNRFVRSTFGIDMADSISKDVMGYDSLSTPLKAFYAKHGMGAREAKEMAEMFSKHSKTVRGGLKIGDTQAWANAGRDDLVRLYYRLLDGAGNEALLDPGLGDRPFLRRHLWGRLVLQLQSFTYTAGERWFAPMVQQALIHPKEVAWLYSSVLALTLATVGNHFRDQLNGRESKLVASLNSGDPQDFFDMTKEAYIRSPFAIGMQGVVMDNIGTMFANPINKGFQALTGTQGELMSTEYLKYRQGQGGFSLLGPAAGLALGTAPKFLSEVGDGDWDTAGSMLQNRTPVLNALPFILLGKAGESLLGE